MDSLQKKPAVPLPGPSTRYLEDGNLATAPLTLDWRGNELCQLAGGDHRLVLGDNKLESELDPNQQEAGQRYERLTPVFWQKFEYFRRSPNKRQRVRFDAISPILKRYFMEQIENRDIETGLMKWTISFKRIIAIFPNVTELHFVNQYKCDDVVLRALMEQIQVINNMVEKVVFTYFAYDRNVVGIPPESEEDICFFDPEKLDKKLMKQLRDELHWVFEYYAIGEGGFKIVMWKGREWKQETLQETPQIGGDVLNEK